MYHLHILGLPSLYCAALLLDLIWCCVSSFDLHYGSNLFLFCTFSDVFELRFSISLCV